jgi:hypothetical protein
MKLFILLLLPFATFSQDIIISADTTINNTWTITPSNRVLRITNNAKISGTGTIVNGIFDINPYSHAFDTSLTVKPFGIYNGDFSANWYGANESSLDNSRYLQRAIDVCAANYIRTLKIPRGVYKYSTPLLVGRYEGSWLQVTLRITGETSFWDSDPLTVLNYEGRTGYAIGFQKNKGSEIDHIKIIGKWEAPNSADMVYFNIPYADFTDRLGVCSDSLIGVAIDPIPNNSGSTGMKIHDMWVTNFSTLIAVSPYFGYNGDILYFDDIQLGDGRLGFMSSQPQEKGNRIRGLNAWGNLHTVFKNSSTGAGNYSLDGANIAGRVIHLFDIVQGGWFSSNFSNIFAERIGSIGTLYTYYNMPLTFNGCIFNFIPSSEVGTQILLKSSSTALKFNSCVFEYYGLSTPLLFEGPACFENYRFSGTITGGIGSIYKTNVQFSN